MEIEAPFLQAIQAIAGTTPGEKQRTINDIVKKIAEAKSSAGYSVDTEMQTLDVPELLKPLVRVEVAKILHQYDVIIEALKSEDMNIVNRALHSKWFFDGSDSSLVNAKYFHENVFPEISLYVRLRIVKLFATYLKNTVVAADFFLILTKVYGVSQATPLLVVCDEDFAFKMIIENKIILSLRMIRALYRKFPNLVMKYLMLSKPGADGVRNIHRINIRAYEAFLPEVANERFEEFMEIYHMHGGLLDMKLEKKATKTFFKTQLNFLVEEPDQYLKLVSLKTATQKLNADNFKKMFKNLFPSEREAFQYSTMNAYLQHYEPEREKVPLILNTFREVYGKDLLSCKDLVDSDLMKILPVEDRVRQARLKLEDDEDWHLQDPERSWRCYLPTSESISIITKEIDKNSRAGIRGKLLRQLIYTSKVNDDKDALLKVLNYIYDRHRNDQNSLYNDLSIICDSFDLATLNSTHWKILNQYIKSAEIQDGIFSNMDAITRAIAAALHYSLLNGLPMDDYIRMFVDVKTRTWYDWNILTEHPDLEKKFLNLFIEFISKQYPFENNTWKDKEVELITSLAFSLWYFNNRHKDSISIGKIKKLSVKDYPWLLERVKVYILGETAADDYRKESFIRSLKEDERDLYYVLICDLDKFWTHYTNVITDVLKVQPQRILDNWKECFKEIKCEIPYNRSSTSFITKSRWYQQLPIKFFEESLKTYKDPKTCLSSMTTLALLTNGQFYTNIIEPFIPNDKKIDVEDPEAANTYNMLLAIASNLRRLNPPVPLDTIARFCVGDYLQIAVRSLMSVCQRVPAAKVMPFATGLIKKPVSVMKHGIRLIYLVAPVEESYTYLTNFWKSKGHSSIRLVVFNQIYDFFRKQPDSRSWRMFQTCLDNLNTNDDEEIFKRLPGLSTIPNEYLHEYIKSVLGAMKAMQKNSDDPKLYIDISCQLIKNIDGSITQILPEEYCQDLIKEYLFVFDFNSDIFAVGLSLTVTSYLLFSEKYESRFKFFGNFFRHSVKEYWDRSHPLRSTFYPMNFMIHEFFDTVLRLTNGKHDVRIFESLLEIFQSALQPHQDAVSYLNLVYSIAYHKSETSVDFATRIARKIPELIKIFSPECVTSMSNRLSSFLRNRTFCESESSEDMLMTIIEVFVNSKAIHCAFFAADMLFNNTAKKLNERHNTLVHTLRNFHHPSVSSLLYEHSATFDFCNDDDD